MGVGGLLCASTSMRGVDYCTLHAWARPWRVRGRSRVDCAWLSTCMGTGKGMAVVFA